MRGPVLDRDRVWFSVQNNSPDGDDTTAHLWSAALGSDGTARDEHVDVGTFDVHDGVLTYLEHSNAPDSRMHVRDLATGDDHVYDTRSGRDCNQLARTGSVSGWRCSSAAAETVASATTAPRW